MHVACTHLRQVAVIGAGTAHGASRQGHERAAAADALGLGAHVGGGHPKQEGGVCGAVVVGLARKGVGRRRGGGRVGADAAVVAVVVTVIVQGGCAL